MADLSSVTDNYLPTASETFADNLSGSISAGATTVPVNSAVEYPDGATVVLTVDPGTALEATFVGKKDTGADQFIECIWTEGNTAVGHDAGATIIDYDSATHYNLLSEALQLIMNQDGTLKDDPIRTALGLSDASNDGWEVFPYTFTVSSGYNKGNKEFDLTVANQDVRTLLSAGNQLRIERSTTAPTQCADLELGSSQYASRASGSLTGTLSTITDDITVEAWVKPESFNSGGTTRIASRFDGTNGWILDLEAAGRITMRGRSGGNERNLLTHSIPNWDKWTHIAACLDLSGFTNATCAVYVNGVSVSLLFNATAAITSFGAVGPMQIGAGNGANFFDGKISDVRVWNVIRTATQIRDNMFNQLVGNETNLIGYWKLNGDFNDSTASANHLTASGGAAATNLDNPFNNTEYAVITNVAYSAPNSTVTITTGNRGGIPNMTLNSPYYSTQGSPYGFPNSRADWDLTFWTSSTVATAAGGAWVQLGGTEVTFPSGKWDLDTNMLTVGSSSGAGTFTLLTQWDTTTPTILLPNRGFSRMQISSAGFLVAVHRHKQSYNLSTQTQHKLYGMVTSGSGTVEAYLESGYINQITLKNTYV